MRRLQPTFQSYDWGKVGAASMVARLTSAGSNGGIKILETQPFAELWMGTHPSGPSTLIGGGDSKDSPDETLQAYLMRDSSALGVDPYSLTTGALPYLFKVLSIEKALSVQAHPDSALAKKLYAERPKVYKDPNHKPEMACALTPFEAMCSFRPPSEIASIVRRVPELVTLLGGEEKAEVLARTADSVTPSSSNETMDSFSRELKAAYSTLMTQPAEIVSAAVSLLKTRLEEEEVVERVHHLGTISQDSKSMENTDPFAKLSPDACALRLCSQFPGDVGVFSPFLLNVVTLEPGDAIFLGANEPHAYLSGDCVEIMACSDNVVRAGLTPKFKDVSILCEMLTYKCGRPEILKGTTFQSEGACIAREYTAPVPEFMLQQFSIPAGESKSLSMPPARSAALLIVICGSGTVESSTEQGEVCCSISEGQVWLQHAGTQMKLSSTNADKDLLIFRSAVAR